MWLCWCRVRCLCCFGNVDVAVGVGGGADVGGVVVECVVVGGVCCRWRCRWWCCCV